MAFDWVVTHVSFMGSVIRIRMDLAGEPLAFDVFNSPSLTPPIIGDRASACFDPRDVFEMAE